MANILRKDKKEEEKPDREWWLEGDADGTVYLECSDGEGDQWSVLHITKDGSIRIHSKLEKDNCNTQLDLDKKGRIKVTKAE